MSVDVFTVSLIASFSINDFLFKYAANMYAERFKSTGKEIDEPTRMILEVYVPSFSVCALLGVTAWMTYDAISVVIHNGQDDEETNVSFMYGYSAGKYIS